MKLGGNIRDLGEDDRHGSLILGSGDAAQGRHEH